jgi:nitroreductase
MISWTFSFVAFLIQNFQADIAKRRRELLGNAASAAPNPKSSASLADDDIFEVDPDITPAAPPSAASSSAQAKVEQPRSKAVSGKKYFCTFPRHLLVSHARFARETEGDTGGQ